MPQAIKEKFLLNLAGTRACFWHYSQIVDPKAFVPYNTTELAKIALSKELNLFSLHGPHGA